MGFLSLVPEPPLSSLVESVWDWDMPRAAHGYDRMLPSAKPQLIVNLAEDETRVYDDALRARRMSGAALDGPSQRSFIIDTAEQTAVVGIVFRAGGAAAFFRERMDRLADDHVDIDALAGGDARGLRGRLLEARDAPARLQVALDWLRRQAGDAHVHPAVAHALRIFDATPELQRIGGVSAHCRLSPRRFGEVFREHVGMSPKRYVRLQRFRRVVAHAHARRQVDWAGVAADCGFHDQPHMAREFRAFSGMTPGEYLRGQGEWADHVPLR